ncbi:hypothetical protein GOP47_0026541 [Adiantum capillus-veneris]|nr:hypothetical protein GOP47_0026541 [Adiantum capillus-veneris]
MMSCFREEPNCLHVERTVWPCWLYSRGWPYATKNWGCQVEVARIVIKLHAVSDQLLVLLATSLSWPLLLSQLQHAALMSPFMPDLLCPNLSTILSMPHEPLQHSLSSPFANPS